MQHLNLRARLVDLQRGGKRRFSRQIRRGADASNAEADRNDAHDRDGRNVGGGLVSRERHHPSNYDWPVSVALQADEKRGGLQTTNGGGDFQVGRALLALQTAGADYRHLARRANSAPNAFVSRHFSALLCATIAQRRLAAGRRRSHYLRR